MSHIVVIEPHTLLRLGLLDLLSHSSTINRLEGFDLSRLNQDAASPGGCDLAILSVSIPEDIDARLPAVERIFSPRSVLLLADSPGAIPGHEQLPDIISGYVSKHASPEVLEASIRVVLAGGTCFPPRNGRTGIDAGVRSAATHVPTATPLRTVANASAALTSPSMPKWPPACTEPVTSRMASRLPTMPDMENASEECEMLGLTRRQYEVLVLLARGYPMKTVGRYLNISVATAKAHTETLYQRLDVHNRNAAVFTAVSRGATLGWPSITKAQQAMAS